MRNDLNFAKRVQKANEVYELIKEIGDAQTEQFLETGVMEDDFISFEFEGMTIINPFLSECGRFEVDPLKTYGEAFTQSDFFKVFCDKVLT